ncbi:MAG TPA: hypothetical protein VGH04_06150, partial [Gemmatimonadaceae bacterium]
MSDRAEDAEILSAQHSPSLEQGRSTNNVLAAFAYMLPRRDGGQGADAIADVSFGPFGGKDGVGAARHRCPGHHPNGFTPGGSALERKARHSLADDSQMHAIVWVRAFGAVGRDRVPVHRGA